MHLKTWASGDPGASGVWASGGHPEIWASGDLGRSDEAIHGLYADAAGDHGHCQCLLGDAEVVAEHALEHGAEIGGASGLRSRLLVEPATAPDARPVGEMTRRTPLMAPPISSAVVAGAVVGAVGAVDVGGAAGLGYRHPRGLVPGRDPSPSSARRERSRGRRAGPTGRPWPAPSAAACVSQPS